VDWMNFLIRSGIKVYKQQKRAAAQRERAFIRNTRKAEQTRLTNAKEDAKLLLSQRHLVMHTLLDKEIGQLSAEEFEVFVAELFEKEGWRASLTPRGADMGVDIDLRRPDDDKYAIVQCKKWTGNVGQPVVRDLYGVMNHLGAPQGYIVTSSNFTRAAMFFAEGKSIQLINGEELLERIQRYKERQTVCSNQQEPSQTNHVTASSTQSVESIEAGHLLTAPLQNDQLTLSPHAEAFFHLLLKGFKNTRRLIHDGRTQQEQNHTSHTRYIQTVAGLQQLTPKMKIPGEILVSVSHTFESIGRCSTHTPENEVRKHFEKINETIGAIFAQLKDVSSIGTMNPSIEEILESAQQCYIALIEDLDNLFAQVEQALTSVLESPNEAVAGRVVRRLPNGDLGIGVELSANFSRSTRAIGRVQSLWNQKAARAAQGCLLPVVLFLLLVAGILTLIIGIVH